jgi:transposase
MMCPRRGHEWQSLQEMVVDTSSVSLMSEGRGASVRRRQFRTMEHKRQIVQETLKPGASVAIVARRHGVNANQVFSWRRQYQRGVLELVEASVTGQASLVPVAVHEPDREPLQREQRGASEPENSGRIEIEFSGGRRVSVWGRADLETLRAVLQEFSRT